MRVVALLVLLLSFEARAGSCWLAYVHGKLSDAPGFGPSNLSPSAGATETDRRNYWRRGSGDTYGDFVLYRPPLKATTILLWFGPFLLLALGFAVLLRRVRRRREGTDSEISDANRKRAAELLASGEPR